MNVGHALETVVFNELERRRAEIGYVKTDDGLEVDFLARHRGAGEELIQVCADLRSPTTSAREVHALVAATKEYPRASARILVLDWDAARLIDAPNVEVLPAYEWLLAPEP